MEENRTNIDAQFLRIPCANSSCSEVRFVAIEDLKLVSEIVCEKCKHTILIKPSQTVIR